MTLKRLSCLHRSAMLMKKLRGLMLRGLQRQTISFGSNYDRTTTVEKQVLLFEDGIYEIDFGEQAVTKKFDAPTDERLRSINKLHDGKDQVLVTSDKRLRVFESADEVVGVREIDLSRVPRVRDVIEGLQERAQRIKLPADAKMVSPFSGVRHLDDDVVAVRLHRDRNPGEPGEKLYRLVYLPGQLLQTIEIPAALAGYDAFGFGRTTDGEIVFEGHIALAVNHPRFVRTTADGEVLEVRDQFAERSASPSDAAMLCGIAPIVPVAPFALLTSVNGLTEAISERGVGVLPRLLRRQPLAFGMPLVVMVLSAGIACWFGKRMAKTRGLDARGQAIWQLIGLMLGPAAVLAVMSLRPRPKQVACKSCQSLRALDQPGCQHCGTDFSTSAADGTEIIFEPDNHA